MPLELGVWRIDQGLVSLQASGLNLENRLQSLLDKDIAIANPGWFVIGREVDTGFRSRLDLLAIDAAGNLVVIELKRNQTPRDVIAQVLEYGSWAVTVRADDIPQIYRAYVEKYHPERIEESFDQAFRRRFSLKAVPEDLNSDHELVVIASEFDLTSERIVSYLADAHDVSINAIFFRIFRDGEREYLTRAWLKDPSDVEAEAESRTTEKWNGEFYVSFGGGRDWNEARKYGFISGGGGAFYSQTLNLLEPGDRVWVNVPGTGYVGVGRVEQPAVPIEQFLVPGPDGVPVPINELSGLEIASGTPSTDDPEKAEYMVRVHWDKAVSEDKAYKELGFFGSQHTVARPKKDKWRHTIERLKTLFGIKD